MNPTRRFLTALAWGIAATAPGRHRPPILPDDSEAPSEREPRIHRPAHQGEKEKARRRKQAAKAAAKLATRQQREEHPST